VVSSVYCTCLAVCDRCFPGVSQPGRIYMWAFFILHLLAWPQLTYTSSCALFVCVETYLECTHFCKREKQYALGSWQRHQMYIKLYNILMSVVFIRSVCVLSISPLSMQENLAHAVAWLSLAGLSAHTCGLCVFVHCGPAFALQCIPGKPE